MIIFILFINLFTKYIQQVSSVPGTMPDAKDIKARKIF